MNVARTNCSLLRVFAARGAYVDALCTLRRIQQFARVHCSEAPSTRGPPYLHKKEKEKNCERKNEGVGVPYVTIKRKITVRKAVCLEAYGHNLFIFLLVASLPPSSWVIPPAALRGSRKTRVRTTGKPARYASRIKKKQIPTIFGVFFSVTPGLRKGVQFCRQYFAVTRGYSRECHLYSFAVLSLFFALLFFFAGWA